jgi:streptogramin lyase
MRAILGFAAILLCIAGLTAAQTPHGSALRGTVTSQSEGAMEGVLIGAKRDGSNITTWVVSNTQGQYAFPSARLEPGKYSLSIRAVGFELPKTSVDIGKQSAELDLRLNRVTSSSRLARQLSNGEWFQSIPGTHQQKLQLGNCVTCHTLERVMFSRFDPDEWGQVVRRMNMHTNNSSVMHPWMRPGRAVARPPADPGAFARFLSSINLSQTDTFSFPLKSLPRPQGKATQVIYTTYELPRTDASPHDTAIDAEGNIWYSDFNSQFLGKLDPRTGNVVEYPVPLNRSGQIAQGGLQIAFDKEGRVYYGNMSQMQIARLDPKTGKMETFKPPLSESQIGDSHLTMIDPSFQHVDGKIWVNIAFTTGEAGGSWHVDLATNTWTRVPYPPDSPPAQAYDVVADSKNNMYGMHFNNDRIWMTDGKTLKTVWYDFPMKGGGCRRGHIDSQDRLWCGAYNADAIAMFDPATQKVKEWKVPTEWSRPYDAEFDDKTYLWTAGMDNDLALRLNVATGEFTEYLLPHETNVRHVDVQKSGDLSSFWLGDQQGNTIVHVEPLTP